ncbi:MAG: hypothetical protein ACR2H3_11890 [Acidimicrobiales bacterium]
MTVLVFGPYPPSPGHEADETFGFVRSLLSSGQEVIVVSPVPSAAHEHLDPGSPRGGLRLRGLVAGHDRVFVRLDAAGLQAGFDSARLRPGRLALGAALRRARNVHAIVDRVPIPISRSWTGTVLSGVALISVATEAERDELIAAGLDGTHIEIRDLATATKRTRADAVPWSGTGREALQRDIRRRAAAARSSGDGDPGPDRSGAAAPLREIAPLGHAPVRSPKPGVAQVKRLIRKLVAWQLDPIIQHVNRLHQATMAAIERADQENNNS